jgi:hypothetical protein
VAVSQPAVTSGVEDSEAAATYPEPPSKRRWAGAVVPVAALVLAIATRAWLARLPARWSLPSLDGFFLLGPPHIRLGRELARGHLPLWNPTLGLGIYEAADINLALLYPPNAVFALLPLRLANELLTIAHVTLAAVGTFFLCRRASLGVASAAVGAIALVTGINLHHLAQWGSTLATFSWCPVAFLAAARLRDRPTPRPALTLALVLGCQLLAGYLQLHLYTVVCLPLFFLPADRPTALTRPLAWAVAAEIVALGLAAVEVAPAMAAIPGSWRSHEAVPDLLHHVFPVHLWDYLDGLAAPSLDPRVPVYGGPLLPPLVLAGIMARGVAPRLRLSALVFASAAVVLSLGDATPIFPLLRRLPISHWLTGPYKWTYLASLGAVLLAAVGAEALLLPVRRGGLAARVWAVLALALVASLPASLAAKATGAVSVVGLLLVHRYSGRRARFLAAAAIPTLLGLSTLAAYDARGVTPDDVPQFFAQYRPAYAYLAGRQSEGRTFVLVPVVAISPRQGEIEDVAQVNTNGVIVTVRLAQYSAAVYVAADRADARSAAGLLRALGVRFVMTRPGTNEWLGSAGDTRVFSSPAADVWEDAAALPRAYLARRVERLPRDDVLARLSDPAVAAGETAVLEDEEGGRRRGERRPSVDRTQRRHGGGRRRRRGVPGRPGAPGRVVSRVACERRRPADPDPSRQLARARCRGAGRPPPGRLPLRPGPVLRGTRDVGADSRRLRRGRRRPPPLRPRRRAPRVDQVAQDRGPHLGVAELEEEAVEVEVHPADPVEEAEAHEDRPAIEHEHVGGVLGDEVRRAEDGHHGRRHHQQHDPDAEVARQVAEVNAGLRAPECGFSAFAASASINRS